MEGSEGQELQPNQTEVSGLEISGNHLTEQSDEQLQQLITLLEAQMGDTQNVADFQRLYSDWGNAKLELFFRSQNDPQEQQQARDDYNKWLALRKKIDPKRDLTQEELDIYEKAVVIETKAGVYEDEGVQLWILRDIKEAQEDGGERPASIRSAMEHIAELEEQGRHDVAETVWKNSQSYYKDKYGSFTEKDEELFSHMRTKIRKNVEEAGGYKAYERGRRDQFANWLDQKGIDSSNQRKFNDKMNSWQNMIDESMQTGIQPSPQTIEQNSPYGVFANQRGRSDRFNPWSQFFEQGLKGMQPSDKAVTLSRRVQSPIGRKAAKT